MRKSFPILLFFALLACAGSTAFAQQSAAPSGPSWERVMALAAHTNVSVNVAGHSSSCKVVSVDAASLTCAGADAAKPVVYQKSEIKKIKVAHRGRSTLIGLGIGAGAGAGIGAGVGSSTASAFWTTSGKAAGVGAAIFGLAFGLIGAIVGALTDFTASTIYKG